MELMVVRDPADAIAARDPVTWAIGELGAAIAARGGSLAVVEDLDPVIGSAPRLIVGSTGAGLPASVRIPDGPEAFILAYGATDPPPVVAAGSDVRGLVYAVLELADRIAHADDPRDALRVHEPILGRPANGVRSVTRLFCSDVQDLPWFRDEGFWRRYLSMLAAQRFNRVSLTLGLGYNFHRNVTDAYLHFAYPFLIDVGGVRVPELPDEERDRNLAMLRFASDEAHVRGLSFQLGLWTHAYDWIESPDAHQHVEGLTPQTHAPYCRDAIAALLEVCPSIDGLTFRVHGEGGVTEGDHGFWRTVFQGVAGHGRTVGIDLHAKGLEQVTIDDALATGMPVTVSPKFWAEHMGLPYHQAAIRETERVPRPDPAGRSDWHDYMRVSEGSRPFTRYGYGDFLREDRPYDVVFRLWAGTQRHLLWGDPAMAAGYGRVASIAGAGGIEWCEPLTFKGREGSGTLGSRTGYADPSLVPDDDWEAFAYGYRLMGRLTYDPEATGETWRRTLRVPFGPAAADAEAALSAASRILPLVTVAHHPSASNNYYWPELVTDMPIVWSGDEILPHPFFDSPLPHRFGTASPLDPEVFSSVTDLVTERLADEPSGRIGPIEVAVEIERLADAADRYLASLRTGMRDPDVEPRRWALDTAIVAGLGRYFACKFRAAVWFEVHDRTGSAEALRRALATYRAARDAWVDATRRADGVYVDDLTYGPQRRLRGTWADRLPAIEADLREMELRWEAVTPGAAVDAPLDRLEDAAFARPAVEVAHGAPGRFSAGSDLTLELTVGGPDAPAVTGVTLRHRAMDQRRTYEAIAMEREGERFRATISGGDLDGAYPLQYAFIIRHVLGGTSGATRYPGVDPDLCSQPYLVARTAH